MSTRVSQITCIFDSHDKSRRLVLDAFGKTVAKNGIIAEAQNPNQPVLTPHGDEIALDEFGGVVRGSTVFLKSDIDSVIEAVDRLSTKRT